MDGSLQPPQGEAAPPAGVGRPRRVLHVLKYYRPSFTGEGVFLERSSAVMQELAPDVAHELLVTHTPRPAEMAEGVTCSTLGRVTYLAADEPGNARRHLMLAWWFLRNLRRYDTVHVRTHADWYFVSYLLARIARRRLVLSATLDDSLPVLIRHYRPRLRALARRGFALFDAYVSISPKLQAETRSTGVDPARCHLVPCGVTVPPTPDGQREAMRASLGIGAADPVLLFVGGLCARKDPLFLIRALPEIRRRHPGTRLLLVGPPLEAGYVRELEDAVAAAGLGEAVFFVGEQINPHPWFAAADILAFASQMEGFGTVVPEAMAHGMPVAVRRLPGVNDGFVLEGETGFLFDDAAGFIAAIDRLAGDPALRRRLGQAGRALTEERFGMRGVAARYLSIYGFPVPAPDPPPRDAPAGERGETGLGCDASVLDRRFHLPVEPQAGPPLLVTMVDAEEAFDWGRPFSRDAVKVGSMASQRLAHRVFERHGVLPVYLTDYPVAAQDAGRGPLRELIQGGQAEVGAQLHPWVTPPFVEVVNEHNSYAGNLPTALELEKAKRLTGMLEDSFGTRPLIYRTGRFGAGPRTGDILKHLGYVADSSVVPCWPPKGCGHAAEAWALSARPYWLDRERQLMEIPVSAALVGRLAGPRAGRLAPWLFHPLTGDLGLTGAAARFGLVERIRLTPEGMTVAEAKRLTRTMLAQGHRVFVLTYHSPSLEPGNTPYVHTAAQRDRFIAWLDEFYAFFREELGGRCASWQEVRFGARAAPAEARADALRQPVG